jgi:pimeloyl-ACP methyl ester carboxylesterase
MAPVVCLPGLLCTSAVWRRSLAAAGVAAYVPELTASDRIERIAGDILRACPEQFVLAGHSMGGYVALEMVRLAPQRIVGLFLSSTSAQADDDEQRMRRADAVERARTLGMAAFASSITRFLLHPQSLQSPALAKLIVDMAESTGFDTFAQHQQAIASRRDQRDLLASIQCPTTVIVGESDRVTPLAFSQEIVAGIPGGELGVIAGAGHMTLVENADSCASALRKLVHTASRETVDA